jgi:peroxiredoxin
MALLSAGAVASGTRMAPQLTLPGLDGTKLNLADWRGHMVVLVFWATWCAPCLTEIPDLVALEKQYHPRGLNIVSVGIDDREKLSNVVRTLGINYSVMVADPNTARSLLHDWGNNKGIVPYTVILDRAGRVYATHIGPIYRKELETLIQPLLDTIPDNQKKG